MITTVKLKYVIWWRKHLLCQDEVLMIAKKGFTFIDLFAGIGGIRLAFEAVGGKCVFASEWDKTAQKTYKLNFGHAPEGDITKIPSERIPDHDILTAGFPCQPFSIIGQNLGFSDTRGTLFFEIERILRDKHPPAFLLENVKNLKSHDKGRTFAVIISKLEELGYYIHHTVLDARDFGLPQKRERTFIVGFLENYEFSFPSNPLDGQYLTLEDILEPDEKVNPKYFASEYIQKKRIETVKNKKIETPSIWHENKGGNVSVNSFSCALRAGASYSYLLVNGKRRLTPREQLRLQGFPEWYQITGSETEIRRQTGNSVPVKVVEAIAHQIIKSMHIKKKRTSYIQPPLLPQKAVVYETNK